MTTGKLFAAVLFGGVPVIATAQPSVNVDVGAGRSDIVAPRAPVEPVDVFYDVLSPYGSTEPFGPAGLMTETGRIAPLGIATTMVGAGAYPTAKASGRSSADPGIYPVSDGSVGNDFFPQTFFPQTGKGSEAAKATVRNRCGDAFCAIQIQSSTRRYEVYWISGCDTFRLSHFKGRFFAHNGGSLTVDLLDSSRKVIARLWGGGKTMVNWDEVYYIRTCNRS